MCDPKPAIPGNQSVPAGGVEPDFVMTIERIAEEDINCCECILGIAEGEGYIEVSGRWDGKVEFYLMCLRCNMRRQEVAGGYLIGQLLARHEEQHGPPDQWPQRTRKKKKT